MSKEMIKNIREWKGRREGSWGEEAGFVVQTDKRSIILAIDDSSSCCESWGYFLTEDNMQQFIGAELREVRVTDTNRSSKTFTRGGEELLPGEASWTRDEDKYDSSKESLDDGDVMFVDILTSKGTLQFVAYNAHNGYYGHSARITSVEELAAATL